MISRDVVFDEESTWDWNRQQPTQVLFDNDTEEEQISAPCIPENSSNTTPTAAEISPPEAEFNEEAAQSLRCVRKRPAWMEDYEVSGIEYPITHFALFSDCDLAAYKEAVKESKWR